MLIIYYVLCYIVAGCLSFVLSGADLSRLLKIKISVWTSLLMVLFWPLTVIYVLLYSIFILIVSILSILCSLFLIVIKLMDRG